MSAIYMRTCSNCPRRFAWTPRDDELIAESKAINPKLKVICLHCAARAWAKREAEKANRNRVSR